MTSAPPEIQTSVSALVRLGPAAASLSLKPRSGRARTGGEYHSVFKGRGMEYQESRPYEPGDDVRQLDWRVTARTGRAHTKLYHEERERPVLCWVDFSASMQFATRGRFKAVRAAECAALLAWSAVQQGDRVGGVVFSEAGHHEIKPRRGRTAVLHLIQHLARPVVTAASANPLAAQQALLRLARVTRPGSLLFLLSDFRDLNALMEAQLQRLARHSEIVLVFIHDPLEAELPPPGLYRLTDGEHEELVDTASPALRRRYSEQFEMQRERLQRLTQAPNLHLIECPTHVDPLAVLKAGLGIKRAA